MKTKIAILLSIIIVLTVGFVSEVKAGDRAIHIDQEGFREVVDETTGSVNHNDCIFWNESLVILVSRVVSGGLTNAYLDVYIEDPTTDQTKTTTAFLNDPV